MSGVWEMKKVYLIHGWGGSDSSEGWFGWLKRELKEKEIEIIVFNMPNTDYPKIKEWVDFLKENIKKDDLNEETYFIGHSIGCQAILRYLEQLPENIKIAGCIFVAGWFNLKKETYEVEEDRKIAEPWIKTPINLEKVKKHTQNFLSIFSDNDPYIPLSDSKIFKEKLNAKIIIKNNEEHFNETQEIKEIMDFVK